MTSVLYLTYDGLTDQLGQSQIAPYIAALSSRGYRFTVVSCEKPGPMQRFGTQVRRELFGGGGRWLPLAYTKRPPVVSTVFDVLRLYWRAASETRRHGVELVHCRGYIPVLVGRRLARTYGVPFVFDMRGFWPEEKVDGGSWDLSVPLYRQVYRFFKREERYAHAEASAVIILTEAGARELRRRPDAPDSGKLAVIPCSVDFDAFARSAADRERMRAVLGIPGSSAVLAYVGSLGTWYMLEEMLDLFAVYRERHAGDARFLMLTPEDPEDVLRTAVLRGIPRESLLVRSVAFSEVPGYLSAADCGVSLIRRSFSKISSSPTKIGEYLAADLPVVTNRGIGDVDDLLERVGAGAFVESFDRIGYSAACDRLRALRAHPPGTIRQRARGLLDIEGATKSYAAVYERALRPRAERAAWTAA
jgi:glycosyltransferase involved in cell wall biosynthesis